MTVHNNLKLSTLHILNRIVVFICILEAKDPHFSEINEPNPAIRIFLLNFKTFVIVVKGKADLANGGLLLVFSCIDDKVLEKLIIIELLAKLFLIDNEVNCWLNLFDCMNFVVDSVYVLFCTHFSDLFVEVIHEVEVLKLQSLIWVI